MSNFNQSVMAVGQPAKTNSFKTMGTSPSAYNAQSGGGYGSFGAQAPRRETLTIYNNRGQLAGSQVSVMPLNRKI